MTEARVEEDPRRIGPDDMTAIIEILRDIAVGAEPAHSTSTDASQDWTLSVDWLQNGPVSSDTEAALPQVLTRIREYYTTRGRTPPGRLELHDKDHRVLLSISP
jgi:hypothetical protein